MQENENTIKNTAESTSTVEVAQEEEVKTPEQISAEDEFNPELELERAVQAARRSSIEILSSLSKQLFDIEPLARWTIIRKKLRGEAKTDTGVTIQAQERSSVGEIVSTHLENLNAGDLVLFSNFAEEVKDCEELTGEKDLYLVREEEIYARLKPRPKATEEGI